MTRRRVVILGSTGSIGTQALDVIAGHRDRFEVVALAAGGAQPELLAQQAIEFDVSLVAVAKGSAAQDVQLALYAEAQRRGYADGDHPVPRLVIGPTAATEAADNCNCGNQGATDRRFAQRRHDVDLFGQSRRNLRAEARVPV